MRARPTPAQSRWQQAHFGVFFHVGINTFFGKEWSDGSLPASGFIPTALDCRQWLATAKAAGAAYAVLTAKHHDGFCLWPTATTAYSVASSPWRDGAGDMVAEFVAACREVGIAPGLYLSPWDRNAACYADAAAYDDFYCRQLDELCTRYGDLFELWFDGAGSEGRTYDWDRIMALVERRQPDAMIFNMGRPTIRWVGNEDGLATEPVCYAVRDTLASAFGKDPGASLTADHWLPPECDVSIRRNWFWQGDDLDTLKTVDELLAIWYRSVGLGCNLLLNVPPDRRGLLDEHDRERLIAFGDEVARRRAAPREGIIGSSASGISVDFASGADADHLWLEEDLGDGQHIDGFRIVAAEDDALIASGRTIGSQRVVVFARRRVGRLRIELDQPGRLRRVAALLTGAECIPDPAAKLDYAAWGAKTDPR